MVLQLDGEEEELFLRSDVRETPTDQMVQGNFNAEDFEVDANGVVNLLNKTSYWSTPALSFVGSNSNLTHEEVTVGTAHMNGTVFAGCPVELPHGAIVTGAIVTGDAASQDDSWTLKRSPIGTATTETLATANINTEDTTISNATIDNNTYRYYFVTTELANGDDLFGAKITYTTDYI